MLRRTHQAGAHDASRPDREGDHLKNGRPRWKVVLPTRVRTAPRWALVAGVVGLMLVLGLLIGIAGRTVTKPAPSIVELPTPPKLTARGQVRPVAQSRVGTLSGGVASQLLVELGEAVEEQQPIARLRGPGGAEVLTAPRRGTIVDLPAHVGDTVMAGATVAVVADLSRLQIATSDVDEFLISQIHRGQPVSIQIDAIERADLRGRVRSIAPQPQTSATGDEHYPVVIDLEEPAPGLRVGMTARVNFGQ